MCELGALMASDPSIQPIVYLVDDDEQQRRELEQCMRESFADVSSFSTGSAVIEALYATDLPAIVISDLQMPEVSGWGVADTVQRLRARGRAIALLVVTGFPEEVALRRALQMKVDDLIFKPVDTADLLASAMRLSGIVSGTAPVPELRQPADLAEVVDALLGVFEMFDRRLPEAVQSEPHVRMMLYSVRQHLSGNMPCISSVCYASGQPLTTALRRLNEIVGAGMLEKVEDPRDKRRTAVRPSTDLLSRLKGLGAVATRVSDALGRQHAGLKHLAAASAAGDAGPARRLV
jgi:CheY-like chemotaxis protein